MLVRRSFLPVSGNFESNLDRLFRDAFGNLPEETSAQFGLPVNVWEDENAYHLEAELPGFSEKDVEITVLGDELRIEAGKEENKEEKDPRGNLIRRERRTGKVSRSLRFAVDIEENDVKAKFEHGLLTIDLPKAKAALPRKIQIR